MLPDLRPFLNRTLLHVGIRGNGRKISSTTVEAVNGSVQFHVYEESNLFFKSMEITVNVITAKRDLAWIVPCLNFLGEVFGKTESIFGYSFTQAKRVG